jgi:streptogramin lyase
MNITSIALLILVILVLLAISCLYQLLRNHMVFNIRRIWITTNDDRWDTYSYMTMFLPSKHNWYGLKLPKDSDYLSK